MINTKNEFEILGVSTNATSKEIKYAYRKLAMQYHPDRNKSIGASEKFREITEAKNNLLKRIETTKIEKQKPMGKKTPLKKEINRSLKSNCERILSTNKKKQELHISVCNECISYGTCVKNASFEFRTTLIESMIAMVDLYDY